MKKSSQGSNVSSTSATEGPKGSAKDEVRTILDKIPEDASLEDIQYHIYVCEKVERGLKDVQEGRVLTQEEVERRMQKWTRE